MPTQPRPLPLLIAALFANSLPLAHAEEAVLPTVDVHAGATPGAAYYAPSSATATKIPVPLKDVPQTVNVITREFIEDQNATSYQDVLRGVPGIGLSVGDGQRDQVTIRGFSAINDQFVDGVRDDALYFRDLSNVERIEVLKGPGSVLYGRGSSGGLINRVTKKPVATPVQSAALTVGEYGQRRVEGDLGATPAGGGTQFRVTGAYEDSEGFRNQYFLQREALAPSVQLDLGSDTRLLLQGEYLSDRRLADQGVPAFRGKPVAVPIATYYGSARGKDQAFVQSDVTAGTATLEHRLDDRHTLRNVLRSYDFELDRNYTTIAKVTDAGAASTVTIDRTKRLRDERGAYNQTELSQRLESGSQRHDLLYGLELGYQRKVERLWTRKNVATYSLFNPQLIVLPEINLAAAPSNDNNNSVRIAALYLQDLVTLSPQWKLLAGLRHDQIRQQRDDRTGSNLDLERTDRVWSPRLGAVYQPDATSSYYAAASRSFQPLADTFVYRKNSDQLQPEETTNYEVGAKYDLYDGRAAFTTSLFQLTRDNMLNTDPADATKFAALGTQRTRGLELSLAGEIAPHWQMQAGYAYLDATTTKSTDKVGGVSIEGKRPALTPRQSVSLWLVRELGRGFSAGAGAQYVGSRFASNDEKVQLDSYTIADAALYYRSAAVDVSLTVKNLFDRQYYVSAHSGANDYNMPGAPRTAAVTTRWRF